MTTDPSLRRRPNLIIQKNKVTLGMNNRLFVKIG